MTYTIVWAALGGTYDSGATRLRPQFPASPDPLLRFRPYDGIFAAVVHDMLMTCRCQQAAARLILWKQASRHPIVVLVELHPFFAAHCEGGTPLVLG